MKHLFFIKLLNTKTFINLTCYQQKLIILKLAFTLLMSNLITHAQSTFTICQGEEVVFKSRYPSTFVHPGCYGLLDGTISPNDGVIDYGNNSFTVAPIFTTTYTVANRVIFAPDSGCNPYDLETDEFTVYVQECETTECNVQDPFNELPWLNELINYENENGLGYYDYIKLYEVENKNYIEIFPEIPNVDAKIYTCNGTLFCERQDSLNCTQFNETSLYNTLYDTNCTTSAEAANPADNKVELQAIGYSNPIQLEREEIAGLSFRIKNNGPCYVYETDFVIEVNGDIIGTEHWIGSESPNRSFIVNTELKHHFKAGTDYKVRIWSVKPNGNSDLNFTNDTLTIKYESFESNYDFQIQQFLPIPPTSNNITLPVSIILDNFSNAKPDEIYIYWSVNGEEQEPLIKEDFSYNLEPTSFWDKFSKNDTIEIGNYLFETGKSYVIEAWVDLPPEIRDENQPQDKITYFHTINPVNIDLAILGLDKPLHKKIDDSGELHLEIVNRGNTEMNEFTIKWFLNEVEQTPIEVQNPNWLTQSNHFTPDEKVSIFIETLNFEDNLDYELRFVVETPNEYIDSNLDNNTFTFNYKAAHKKYYEADLYVEVCKEDSVVLSASEYSIYRPGPPVPGGPTGCEGYCSINFNDKRWMLDGELIDTTLSTTFKPATDALYTFSTDAYSDCDRNSCSGPFNKRDITVGVVLVDCEKPTSLIGNCANHLGKVLPVTSFQQKSNIIVDLDNQSSESSIRYAAYDIYGIPINFTSAYVKFDYELLGPKTTLPANFKDLSSYSIYQPVTITCLEEIGLIKPDQSFRYEVCGGDQIEESFHMPPGLSSEYNEVICDNLQNNGRNAVSIDSHLSEDCNFIFDVEERSSKSSWESINFTSKLQTGNYSTPFRLSWNFVFNHKNNCQQSCPNTPGLMQTSNTFVCDGDWVYVREAFSTMDENSVKAYVLHEEKEFDGVNYIEMNQQGRFTNPGETYSNQRLYISAVIGSPNEDGTPILDSACTVWTPYGAKYTFLNPVEINVVDEKCENEAYYIDVSVSGGVGGLSPYRAYRSVSDGVKTYNNVSVGEVVTFGPYHGESDYHITAKDAKGCTGEYVGAYNCGAFNRNVSINWKGSDIFEVKYEDMNLAIESARVFNTNGQTVQANVQLNNNNCEIELKNQSNGSLFFVQLLVKDINTGKSFWASRKLHKN